MQAYPIPRALPVYDSVEYHANTADELIELLDGLVNTLRDRASGRVSRPIHGLGDPQNSNRAVCLGLIYDEVNPVLDEICMASADRNITFDFGEVKNQVHNVLEMLCEAMLDEEEPGENDYTIMCLMAEMALDAARDETEDMRNRRDQDDMDDEDALPNPWGAW